MKKKNYFVYKNANNELFYVDYNKLKGFTVNPKNKIEYGGIAVNQLILIKPSFIDKVLKKKIKRKLDYYLNLIIGLIDSDDTDDGTLRDALNEITRYRLLVLNNYRKYLDDKYTQLLLTKITLLEQELKRKILYEPVYEEIEHKKSR